MSVRARIETLGKIAPNDQVNFSGNRSNANHYTATTSVHSRTPHLPSMQQNDFMPLPTHTVNLVDEVMDFCKEDVGVKNNLSSSVPLSKSYDNLTHKNGSGENRLRYNPSSQRKQLSETKLNKSSPLYPNTLQPFDSPKDALEKCLLQIESPEWEIVMQSLQGIVRLSRYHPEVLVSALHRIVTSLSKQIRSLRSQVTKAACIVSQELFVHLGKVMDPEVEELAPALLSRTCDANKFLQHDANAALDSMVDKVTPIRSATFLLLKGAKHRNAVVRTTACRLLARLCRNLSVGQVYALPRDTRDLLLNAAAKFLLEGSLETRAYAKELFSVLAREPKFMKLMNEVVPAKTMEAIRKPLIKIVSQNNKNPIIRDIAISIVKNRAQSNERFSNEHALFFIGDESVGKSSLILQFFDKNEVPKPTLALDYLFFRKSGKSLVKDVFHVWELGGGTSSFPMISVISNLKVNSLTIVLMLDLSSLNRLWNTLEACLRAAKVAVLENKSISNKEVPHFERENGQEVFPVPLVIIGGKYDKFQSLEPKRKRIVCQCLRFVAHLNGASLIFYSSNDASLAKKTKEFLISPKSNVHNKVINTDYKKPLFIPAGTDSFANIEQKTDIDGPGTFEKYKQIFTTQFEQENSLVVTVPDDPALDPNFREPAIDSLRQRKDEELEFMRHHEKGRQTRN